MIFILLNLDIKKQKVEETPPLPVKKPEKVTILKISKKTTPNKNQIEKKIAPKVKKITESPKKKEFQNNIVEEESTEDSIEESLSVSSLRLLFVDTPDKSLQGAELVITYLKEKVYFVSCAKKNWKKKCLLPFVGNNFNFGNYRIFVVNDPKIESTFIFKFFSSNSVWSLSSVDSSDIFYFNPANQLSYNLGIGSSKIKLTIC